MEAFPTIAGGISQGISTGIQNGAALASLREEILARREKSLTDKRNAEWENGYKKADRFPFEIYHTNFKEHPEGKMTVDFCIPIN